MTFGVLQLACLGMEKVLLFLLDVILTFLDMTRQHLQPEVAQPADLPSMSTKQKMPKCQK